MLVQSPYSLDGLTIAIGHLCRRWKKGDPILVGILRGGTDRAEDAAPHGDEFARAPGTLFPICGTAASV